MGDLDVGFASTLSSYNYSQNTPQLYSFEQVPPAPPCSSFCIISSSPPRPGSSPPPVYIVSMKNRLSDRPNIYPSQSQFNHHTLYRVSQTYCIQGVLTILYTGCLKHTAYTVSQKYCIQGVSKIL